MANPESLQRNRKPPAKPRITEVINNPAKNNPGL
jgi:hypothetical protein